MTPTQIEDHVRAQYNAVGDTFFTQAEILRHIFDGQMILAKKAWCIRNVYTTTTTAGTQEYAKPSRSLSVKRITYNGVKLAPSTMREDDALTFSNQTTTAQGSPTYYYEWGSSFFLRPVPDSSSGTLKIYSFDKPQTVTSTSTLDLPDTYHDGLPDYILWRMALKDKNPKLAAEYKVNWDQFVRETQAFERKALRGDSFTGIQDVENLQETVIGAI